MPVLYENTALEAALLAERLRDAGLTPKVVLESVYEVYVQVT